VRPAYAAVIADEAQDLTLVGLRLVRALAGDGANRLLLIGDCQQAVYPGGFRLADAGLTIRGSAADVLRSNHRNAPAILDAALQVVAGEPVEDLDGTSLAGHPQLDRDAGDGGDGRVVTVVRRTVAEHDEVMVAALLALRGDRPPEWDEASPLADTAVLCSRNREADRYRELLVRAGLPVMKLTDYDGRPVDAIKIGTFVRAKGLEFASVFLPRYQQSELGAVPPGAATGADRHLLATHHLFVAMTRARRLLWLGSVE
jgi:superfamily I DNA/RNA helicase